MAPADPFASVVELRDPLHGPIPVGRGELDVIDQPLFQRLRGVKQLGFAEYVFPGAVHNRYLHSIGAMHLAGRAFDAIARQAGWLDEPTRRRFRQLLRLGALLHDVGHAPMSHAAEVLMPRRADLALPAWAGPGKERASHEEMSLKLVVDSPLARAIDAAFGPHGLTAEHVATILGDYDTPAARDLIVDGVDHRPLLHALVSGELDVDRMDYLLRDSYFTGVSYGRYDLDWLMSHLLAVRVDDGVHLGLSRRALESFEHFLLARYHMFQVCYFHPKSDIYDAMLGRWLAAVGDDARFPADPAAYVWCDDPWLRARLRDSDDEWARRITERRPHKLLLELRGESTPSQRQTVDARLTEAGIDSLWLTARPVLSRYARSPVHLRTHPLYVQDWKGARGTRVDRIEDVTDLFGRYEKARQVERLYVRPEDASRGQALVDALDI